MYNPWNGSFYEDIMDQVTSNEEARPLKDVELDDAFTEIAKDTKVSTVSFSPQETEILDLYDQLQDLRLENALMNAQISQAKGTMLNSP